MLLGEKVNEISFFFLLKATWYEYSWFGQTLSVGLANGETSDMLRSAFGFTCLNQSAPHILVSNILRTQPNWIVVNTLVFWPESAMLPSYQVSYSTQSEKKLRIPPGLSHARQRTALKHLSANTKAHAQSVPTFFLRGASGGARMAGGDCSTPIKFYAQKNIVLGTIASRRTPHELTSIIYTGPCCDR